VGIAVLLLQLLLLLLLLASSLPSQCCHGNVLPWQCAAMAM
jgi:hypothetical protein